MDSRLKYYIVVKFTEFGKWYVFMEENSTLVLNKIH